MNANELSPGDVYFIVMYDDEELRIPTIQTLVYLRKTADEKGRSLHIFREVMAHQDGAEFFVREADLGSLVIDKAGLIGELAG